MFDGKSFTIPAIYGYEESPDFALVSSDGFIVEENITQEQLFELISELFDPDTKFSVQVWVNGEGWKTFIS